jgi:hypothetical protein
MAKKEQIMVNEADQLTEQEAALDKEMQEADDYVVVDEGEAAGDEELAEPAPERAERPEKPEKPAETTVPLGALDSERHKRKEVEARMAVLEEQLRRMQQPVEQKPAAPAEMPDPVLDPSAFQGWLNGQMAERSRPVQEMQHQHRVAGAMSELRYFASSSEAQFSQEHPDYGDALAHAQRMKAQEFRAYGFRDEEIPGQVAQVEAAITLLAKQRGVNPAAVVYEYAKMTGFKGGAATGTDGDKIVKLAAAQRNTQSTAGAGGTQRMEEYTIERLAAMSHEDIAKVPDEIIKKVLGG